LIVYCTTVGYT